MRTKNFNLKKKIAFIASVTMIATTAAYLPAEVAQNIGIGSGIVASAADGTAKSVDTFYAFVKVNGKYLTTNGTKYEYANNLTSVSNGYQAVVLSTTTATVDSKYAALANIKTNPLTGATSDYTKTLVKGEETQAAYNDQFVANGTVPLPESTPVNAEVEIEFVAKEKNAITSGTTSVITTLDDHGRAKIASDSKNVILENDNLVKSGNTYTSGDREIINLSGLAFEIAPTMQTTFTSNSASPVGSITASTYNIGADSEEGTDDDTYVWTKSGNSYARNYEATLTSHVDPGAKITVNIATRNNWTLTGADLKTATGGATTVELTMGSNNKAVSRVITYTNSTTGETENYILTVNNAAEVVTLTGITISASFLDDVNGAATPNVAALAMEAVVGGKSNTAGAYDASGTALVNTKVKKSVESQTVNGATKFVNVYTVYNNATETTSTPASDKVIEISGFKKSDGTEEDTNETKTVDGSYQYAKSGNKLTLTPAKSGNMVSPVMQDTNGKFVQFVFTTEYEIKVDVDGNGDVTDDKDTTVAVSGTKFVTRPEDPTKAGYTFKSYNKGYVSSASLGTEVTLKGQAAQQADLAPTDKLTAIYEANDYYVLYDANGGNFGTNKNDGTVVTSDSDGKYTQVSKKLTTDNADTLETDTTWAVKPGYEFKGWALTADASADDVLNQTTFEDERPTEKNATLKLYAVWAAKEVTVDFKVIPFKTTANDGASADINEQRTGNVLTDYWKDGITGTTQADTAVTKTGSISNYTVKTDGTYGDLPVAYLKGYTFAGWYKVVESKTDAGKAKPVLVTSTTEVSSDDVYSNGAAADLYSQTERNITLFAMFTRNTYAVDFDLDGGEWDLGDIYPTAYKYDKDGNVAFFNGNNEIKAGVASYTEAFGTGDDAKYQPTKGAGYYGFDYWLIGDGVTNYKSSELAGGLKLQTEPSDVTFKAVYKTTNSGYGQYFFDLNDGDKDDAGVYQVTRDTDNIATAYTAVAPSAYLVKGASNAAVKETVSADSDILKVNNVEYRVMRPGYKFTGWYTDKDCTTKADFTKYPNDTETPVYAGWKALSSSRYHLNYSLVTANGSLVDKIGTTEAVNGVFTGTFMGETGSVASAKDASFTVDGVKYVFSPSKSEGYKTEDTITASYAYDANGIKVVNGEPVLSSNYMTIYGTYVAEGSEPVEDKDLGTATNVAVKDGTVTWTAADNADHYRIQKTVNGKTYYGAKVTAAKATYTVPVEEHEIAVVAYNADESEKTVSTVVKVSASTKLGKATNVKCAEDGTVTFSAATGATKYQVAKIVNGKTYYSAKSDATSIKITPATEDYEVYVIAFDSTGKLSTHSETIKVSAAASTLEAVDDSTITVDGDGKVTWAAAKGAVAYKVFKITKNSEGKEVTNWGSRVTTTSYTFKDLPKTDYKVYVAAIDENGKVKYSAKKKISSLPSVTNVQLSADKKTVSWTAPTGTNADKIVKYQVAKFDTTANKTAYSLKADAPATSITMKNAAVAGTKIFVLAFDADGNSSYSASIDVE